MELSFIQIGLILIVTMIAAVDQFNFLESLYRPIVIGPIVGAIMGDLQTGLIVGGSYELMMIGAMPVGGAQPPNAVIGGIMATVFAVQSGLVGDFNQLFNLTFTRYFQKHQATFHKK